MSPITAVRRTWSALKPPPSTPDGTMSLYDHLRELRYRVIVSGLAVLVTTIVAAFFYTQLIAVVRSPWEQAVIDYQAANPGASTLLVNKDVVSPFMLALQVSAVAGLITACPVWLWQLWRFVVPALLENERRYAISFIGAAVPLFLAGCALGYVVLPKGIAVMLEFTVQGVTNMQDVQDFLKLELLLILMFGLSFLLPVVLVMVNLAGVVTGEQLGKARTVAIFLCFVFGAVATPSTDPFSMIALSLPMALMYLIAELICRRHDKRRAKRLAADEMSVSLD
ncbi:MAG: twin-arginine translocase subunit TatC [Actinomycetia bacterium]|nr:twin-arginine translocase subunit TatC [Actinomycetes bacterium]